MCELMGMCFNRPVNVTFSFKEMVHRGNNNPHGWGLAFYPGDSKAAQVIKEPRRLLPAWQPRASGCIGVSPTKFPLNRIQLPVFPGVFLLFAYSNRGLLIRSLCFLKYNRLSRFL